MVDSIVWLDQRTGDGVAERSFQILPDRHPVPGVLWLPVTSTPPFPVVLLGHGGSSDKRSRRNLDLAHWFTAQAGLAALAIDGPYHGDRTGSQPYGIDYHTRIADDGIEVVLDRMTNDWQAAVDALAALGFIYADPLAYLGVSMGTRFGLPLVATMGPRFRCAIFGKFGLRQAPILDARLAAPQRFMRDAQRITVPIHFHMQWDDELFPRDGQLALFDALGSTDKQLAAHAGGHNETRPEAMVQWRDFVVRHMGGG